MANSVKKRGSHQRLGGAVMFSITRLLQAGALIFALSLAACTTRAVTPRVYTGDSTTSDGTLSNVVSGAFYCNASLNQTSAAPGQMLTLTITAQGGYAPYAVPGWVNSFSSSTSLTGSYNNPSASSIVISRTVLVTDSTGKSATCGFSVTITGTGSGTPGGGNLSCQITATKVSPRVGESITFTVDASGGNTNTYTFGVFSPQYGYSTNSTSVSSTQVKIFGVSYGNVGMRTANITVSNGGNAASCYLPINVVDPKIHVSGNASSTVGTPIVLTAYPSGFDPAINTDITFTESEAGVSLVSTEDPSGNFSTATLTATDGQRHEFDLTVTASSSDGVSATKVVHVLMDAVLVCSLQILDPLVPGVPIRIKAVASTGEPLVLSEVVASPDGTIVSASSDNPLSVRFAAPGMKYFSAKAQSTSRSAKCNGGFESVQILDVRSGLSQCSVVASPNPAVVGAPVQITAQLPASSGVGPFQITVVTNGGYSTPVGSPVGLTQTVKFAQAGSWQINMTVRDVNGGAQASCSTYATIQNGSGGLLTRVYKVSNGFSLGNGLWKNYQIPVQPDFVSLNIDIPARRWVYGYPGVYAGGTEWFAVAYTGKIKIDTAGCYRFKTTSNDGSVLFLDVNQNGTYVKIVDNDGTHALQSGTSGQICLAAGFYNLEEQYYQGTRGEIANQLLWKPPYQSYFTIIPPERFLH